MSLTIHRNTVSWLSECAGVVLRHVEEQRGFLLPWSPVAMACGIGLFFAWPTDPGRLDLLGLMGLTVICFVVAWRAWPVSALATMLALGLALVGLGILRAELRSDAVAGPVLGWHYYGPVEGRVVAIDRSASGRPRITLDKVRMSRLSPENIPRRVRLSLSGLAAEQVPPPGGRVMTTAHLDGPRGAVEPGGFDFRRYLWFQKIGAVGYTRVPILIAEPPDRSQRVFRTRMVLSEALRDRLPGDVGGFAAAVTTGDRSGVSQEALAALRGSNLAHLLAISGLHMGLLAGLVYGFLRRSFALVPWIALRVDLRRVAALGSLAVASMYLALSGGNIATERAFIMVAVALTAVMLNRRALSLRAVAIAAMIVLMLRPEALLSPGFQMSFAATTALVAVFGWIRDADLPRLPKWARPVMALLISSMIAGLATAPIGAAQFNTLSHYGLLANLLSVPVMGMVIIPAALLAAVLAPVGLDMIGLVPMGWGISWTLAVAETVAALPGAQSLSVSPPVWVLPVLSLGALWLFLWNGRPRWAGVVPVVGALWFWPEAERPLVLIEDRGGLVGVLTENGRALSRERGAGFVAEVWLENDGDPSSQQEAATLWPREPEGTPITSPAGSITHLAGKRALASWSGCAAGDIVVVSVEIPRNDPRIGADCDVFDPGRLSATGAMSWHNGRWTSAASVSGQRRWSHH